MGAHDDTTLHPGWPQTGCVCIKILRVSCVAFRVGSSHRIRVGYESTPSLFNVAISGLSYIRVGINTIRVCMNCLRGCLAYQYWEAPRHYRTSGGGLKNVRCVMYEYPIPSCSPYRHSVRAIITGLGSLPYIRVGTPSLPKLWSVVRHAY